MSAPRTFLRFAICGLFINALVVACTVKEGTDDEVSCNPGDRRACVCDDGSDGERRCNSDGDGYGRCVCDSSTAGTNAGGAAGDGPVPSAGTGGYSGSSTGGTAGWTSGGYSGSPASGGAGGGNEGGGNEGGAGGSGDVTPLECAEDPEDDCANCYQQACCDEWSACLADDGDGGDDCATQFLNIMACAQVDRDTRDATPADLKACGEDEIDGGGAWSDGLRPPVKPVIDCLAGGTGWGANTTFSTDACKVSCFDQL